MHRPINKLKLMLISTHLPTPYAWVYMPACTATCVHLKYMCIYVQPQNWPDIYLYIAVWLFKMGDNDTENYSKLFKDINDQTASWLLNYITQKELNNMLLSLLLTDRISGLKRQIRSAFVITSPVTSAELPLLLTPGKCCRVKESLGLVMWLGNCHQFSWAVTIWEGATESSWSQQRIPWGEGQRRETALWEPK